MEYRDKDGLPSSEKTGVFTVNAGAAGTYAQAVKLADALREIGAEGRITVGGVRLVVTDENRTDVESLLEKRGVNELHQGGTLTQQIAIDGGLDASAEKRPSGQAAVAKEQIRRMGNGDENVPSR